MENSLPHQDKIRSLFRHRQIDWLWERSALAPETGFYSTLMRVQSRIYDLDAYLESHWRLSPARLHTFWEALELELATHVSTAQQRHALLSDIRQYQAQELMTRSGGDVSLLPTDAFYFFKTCDVRLIRELILLADPPLRQLIPASAWLAYDMLTELEDDLEDQTEDLDTYNVNRYLAVLHAHGQQKAVEACHAFADQLTHKALREARDTDFPCHDEWLTWMLNVRQRLNTHLAQALGIEAGAS